MRFPDMETEWALLWVHFLWSGGLTVVFSLGSWWKVGVIQKTFKQRVIQSVQLNRLGDQRRRLFRIAEATCVALLLNMATTLSASFTLEEWSASTNLALYCQISETHLSRRSHSPCPFFYWNFGPSPYPSLSFF
jgi:hypothetical protein